jgi:uncharacterized protein
MPEAQPACPICGKLADPRLAPFCSRRCADVDLGRWLTGVYRVPASADEREDEAPFDPSSAA